MRFTLHYRGGLRPNADPKAKHQLRRAFHGQLKPYWERFPLQDFREFLEPQQPTRISVLRNVGAFSFAPLVCLPLHLIAELEVQILWPQDPGSIFTSGGDIDNRLKTLFDALKVPEQNALPPGAAPEADEHPFFCLLEDDSLITRVAVETDRLLEPVQNPSEVELFVRVTTRQLRVLRGTVGLA